MRVYHVLFLRAELDMSVLFLSYIARYCCTSAIYPGLAIHSHPVWPIIIYLPSSSLQSLTLLLSGRFHHVMRFLFMREQWMRLSLTASLSFTAVNVNVFVITLFMMPWL